MLSYLRRKMKTIMIVVAVLFAGTMFYGLGYKGIKNVQEGPKKGSIATINGREIDHVKLQQTVNRIFSQEKGRVTPDQAMMDQTLALQQVIEFTIMLDESRRSMRVSGEELEQAIDQIMQANKIPNRNALKDALKNMGQEYSQFKNSLKEEILVSKMVNTVRGGVTIGPNDLREVQAGHILITPKGNDEKSDFEARAKAEDILAKIKKGQNFAALAMQFSDDPGSAKNGGDLGYFSTGSMVPEFEKVAFSLKPGEVSPVTRTQFGYHIIKVYSTRLRKVDQKGKDINEVILSEKQDQAMRKWLYDLHQKNKIDITDPLLKAYALMLSGKLNEAISSYNEAAMANPANPYVHLFLGDAYLKAGNNELAMAEYGKVSDLAGADPNILIALGDIYVSRNMTTLALEQYRKASLIAGDSKKVHEDLKAIFKKLGASADVSRENSEIKRIEKKEKFEKEIQDKLK